tara:strand:+ start:11559 stop:12731 length:1173 start_codon:yes stop_codon:yes gene_type:complete
MLSKRMMPMQLWASYNMMNQKVQPASLNLQTSKQLDTFESLPKTKDLFAISDHLPFHTEFSINKHGNLNPVERLSPLLNLYADVTKSNVSILSWNIMMQCRYNEEKNRYNNGYCAHESKEQYLQRINSIAETIAKYIKNNPNIAVISLQEAPIDKDDIKLLKDTIEKHLPNYFEIDDYFDCTDMGVMTFCNKKIINQFIKLHSVYSEEMYAMNSRYSCFSIGQNTFYSNIHVPHDNPIESLDQIATNIAIQIKNNVNNSGELSFIFTGDCNVNPCTLKSAIEKQILTELLADDNLIEDVIITACQNQEGHLKNNKEPLPDLNSNQDSNNGIKNTVDYIFTINVKFKDKSKNIYSYSKFIPFLLGGAMLISQKHQEPEHNNHISKNKPKRY